MSNPGETSSAGDPVPSAIRPQPTQTLTYATSKEFPADVGAVTEAYRQFNTMIARNGATLPARCAVCGSHSQERPVRLTFNWDSSFRRTRISTVELRQRAYVYASFCTSHHRAWHRVRRTGTIGTGIGVTLLLTGLITGIWSESSDVPAYTPMGIALLIAGFGLMTASLFYFSICSRTITCQRVVEGYIYIDGASEGLLAQLAQLPENHPSA